MFLMLMCDYLFLRIKSSSLCSQNPLGGLVKRPSTEDPNEANRKRLALGNGSSPSTSVSAGAEATPATTAEPGSTKPIDRQHADAVINFLLRLACQVCSVCIIQY